MKIWCVDEGVACVQEAGEPFLVKCIQVLTRVAFPFVLAEQEREVSIGIDEGLAC